MNQEARLAVEEWMKAFVEADVDRIVGLHAPGATFTGTSSAKFTCSSADIRAYFVRVLRDRTPASAEVLDCWSQDLGNVAVVTVLDRIAWRDSHSPQELRGRGTFVLQKQSGRWQIVSFHRSEAPVG